MSRSSNETRICCKGMEKEFILCFFPLTLVFSCPTFSSGGFTERTTPKIKSIVIDIRARAKERKKRKEKKKRASTEQEELQEEKKEEDNMKNLSFFIYKIFLSFISRRTYEGKKGQKFIERFNYRNCE